MAFLLTMRIGAYIGQGGFHDFTIDQGGNYGVHSAYITLASTGDATCIEWISVTNRVSSVFVPREEVLLSS